MGARPPRDLLPLTLAVSVALVPLIHEGGLLAALPVLVLAVPLLCGRYPGEAALERLRDTDQHGCRAPAKLMAPASDCLQQPLLRSGLLIAASLATRPPPASASAP